VVDPSLRFPPAPLSKGHIFSAQGLHPSIRRRVWEKGRVKKESGKRKPPSRILLHSLSPALLPLVSCLPFPCNCRPAPPRATTRSWTTSIASAGSAIRCRNSRSDFLYRDSILAAPIVTDLALLLSCATTGIRRPGNGCRFLLQIADYCARSSIRNTTSSFNSGSF